MTGDRPDDGPAPPGRRRKSRLTRRLVIVAIGLGAVVATRLGGPLTSGALFLLLPAPPAHDSHDLLVGHDPVHKGHIDLATGLYIRQDEDLIVRGSPPLVLRRTYLSRYHASRQFGVGTTHDGEWYVIGDGARFQWASLIRADGSRIAFARTSPGSSFVNAMYEDTTPGDGWTGARLGWTGFGWALRRLDGSLFRFRACAPGYGECSIVSARDADGHVVEYRRDGDRLARMVADHRWIAFDYDAKGRIVRAHDSGNRQVRYAYDARGRLTEVTSSDGVRRVYSYTDADEMATIDEPGWSIQNFYEAGRCVRQLTHVEGQHDPYVFQFSYQMRGKKVAETESRESSGLWRRYTYDGNLDVIGEWRGVVGGPEAGFEYERDPTSHRVTTVTLTCADRTGRPARHTSYVGARGEAWLKQDMVQTYCVSVPELAGE
jgi:YD repeat-containing protein